MHYNLVSRSGQFVCTINLVSRSGQFVCTITIWYRVDWNLSFGVVTLPQREDIYVMTLISM